MQAQTPQAPAQEKREPAEVPQCPQHGAKKPSTKGKGWYCPHKLADGTWCGEGQLMRNAPGPQLPAAPTAASLVTELAQHMAILLDVPAPLARAPRHFLLHWLLMLERIRRLLPDDD